MTVLLALLTFLFFAGLDYVFSRRRAGAAASEAQAIAAAACAVEPRPEEPLWVAGYELPERLHYHRGHTWARVLSGDTVAVGLDDFARRLVGRVKRVRLPRVGAWLRQGGRGFELEAEGRRAALLSPVEGEVVEVNDAARRDPALVAQDPYGHGWLVKVRSQNLAANLRNLMDGTLARRFTEDAREQLELRLMALSGSVLQDGGAPAPDFAEHLDPEDWRRLADAFLLGEERSEA